MNSDDTKRMQQLLGFTGRDVDGNAGPATYARLFKAMGAPSGAEWPLGLAAAVHFPIYDVDSTPLTLAGFIGQTAHETGRYRYLREIWGPSPEQLRYEGRSDLGNTVAGDGQRYLGRGILQVTGRGNYRRIARLLGIDIETTPALLERPDIGLWSACIWWADNKAGVWARDNDIVALSRLINRGSATATRPANGEAERIQLTAKARALIL